MKTKSTNVGALMANVMSTAGQSFAGYIDPNHDHVLRIYGAACILLYPGARPKDGSCVLEMIGQDKRFPLGVAARLKLFNRVATVINPSWVEYAPEVKLWDLPIMAEDSGSWITVHNVRDNIDVRIVPEGFTDR